MKHSLSILTIVFLFFGCSKGDDSSTLNTPNQTKKYNVTQCGNFYEANTVWTLPKPNFTNCDPN